MANSVSSNDVYIPGKEMLCVFLSLMHKILCTLAWLEFIDVTFINSYESEKLYESLRVVAGKLTILCEEKGNLRGI